MKRKKFRKSFTIKRSAYSGIYSHYMQDEFGNIYMEITEQIH